MNFKGMVFLLAAAATLILAGGAPAQEKAFLWDGHQWPQLPFDAKVGYVKGVGNMADFEAAASSKGQAPCVSQAFSAELKTKTVNQVIQEVDKFYQDNPGKLNTTVLEVILVRCTKLCPPEYGAGAKK
jgi:hypothetical protein